MKIIKFWITWKPLLLMSKKKTWQETRNQFKLALNWLMIIIDLVWRIQLPTGRFLDPLLGRCLRPDTYSQVPGGQPWTLAPPNEYLSFTTEPTFRKVMSKFVSFMWKLVSTPSCCDCVRIVSCIYVLYMYMCMQLRFVFESDVEIQGMAIKRNPESSTNGSLNCVPWFDHVLSVVCRAQTLIISRSLKQHVWTQRLCKLHGLVHPIGYRLCT